MDEKKGPEVVARGCEFGKPTGCLLDQVIRNYAATFRSFESIFPACRAFPEQNGVAFRLFRRPILEMQRADSARIRANPRHWIGAGLQARAHIQLEHDRWLRILREKFDRTLIFYWNKFSLVIVIAGLQTSRFQLIGSSV